MNMEGVPQNTGRLLPQYSLASAIMDTYRQTNDNSLYTQGGFLPW